MLFLQTQLIIESSQILFLVLDYFFFETYWNQSILDQFFQTLLSSNRTTFISVRIIRSFKFWLFLLYLLKSKTDYPIKIYIPFTFIENAGKVVLVLVKSVATQI
jgi:hypothetical protein